MSSPEKTADSIQDAWDEAADHIEVDAMRAVRYGMGLRYLRAHPRGARLLEVGCGQGGGLSILAKQGFTNLSGIDVSPERVRRARSRLPPSVDLRSLVPDAPLPFADATFDIVLSLAVIEHAIDPVEFCRQIARVLRSGGVTVISSDCYSWRVLQLAGAYRSVQPIDRAMRMSSFIRIFESAGLRLEHFDTFNLPSTSTLYSGLVRRALARFLGATLDADHPREDDATLASQIASIPADYSRAHFFQKRFRNYLDDENIFYLRKV